MTDIGSTALAENPHIRRATRTQERRAEPMPCTAELAECTCPEPCERDHDTD
jgi:hypothetical protein